MSNIWCYINVVSILEKITSPEDLKKLSAGELECLTGEIRARLVQVVSERGGHLAPNLGVVELTIAMLRCFDLPLDRIIWDVGHQSYVYKLLTNRQQEFEHLREYRGCCGFPVRNETVFDCYSAGHAGVAISAALGMCAAQEAAGEKHKIAAVVGDGALGSGVALEGLNQVREHGKNLVIILNDNKMAISPNVGALSRFLNRIMVSRRYRGIKNTTKTLVNLLPKSRGITHVISKLEDAAKNLLLPGGWFQELGIRYLGPVNGHNIAELERTFKAVQHDEQAVIIHVITEKGRGYAPAVAEPERFHGVGKFDPETGKSLQNSVPGFSAALGEAACELAAAENNFCAVVAAMTSGVGLSEFARLYPARFYDAGMAESHAVSFASGLAAAGNRVLCAIYATFMQRSLDNIFHDVCLMKLPVVFALDRAGLVEDGPTHHGIYDLGFLLGLPNLTILSPGCEAELKLMLQFAWQLNAPAVIRYPRGSSGAAARSDLPVPEQVELGRSVTWRNGNDLAIYAAGAEAVRAMAVADELKKHWQLETKVVNIRFLKPFDKNALQQDLQKMMVFTLEDHVTNNGLGAIAGSIAGELAAGRYPIYCLGIPADRDVGFGAVDCLRAELGLDVGGLARRIAEKVFYARSSANSAGNGA